MHVEIEFLKVSGAGNDFLLIDNLHSAWSVDWPAFAMAACSRPFGVGADGILVLEPSSRGAFKMRYFNADGSYGGMCGNGGRCVARYAAEHGISESTVLFEACGRMYQGDVMGQRVALHLPDVMSEPRCERLPAGKDSLLDGWIIDTGSPHIVFKTEAVEEIEVIQIGRAIRNHRLFGPSGTNVNFYRREADLLVLRTYERGVEGETLACGTGAVATALVSSLLDKISSPVRLLVRSGEELLVSFRRSGSGFTGVTLEGSAHFVFSGTIVYDDEARRMVPIPLHFGEQGH